MTVLRRGRLIVFSGVDGGGKSTQIERLVETLRRRGERPRRIWSRGGYTPGMDLLKRLLRRAGRGRGMPAPGDEAGRRRAFRRPAVRSAWLGLAILDLAWLYGVVIRWHLLLGRTVVCDRYLADTAIDFRLGFRDPDPTRGAWWRWLGRVTPLPDAAFLLMVPVEVSLRRAAEKEEPFPDPPEVRRERFAAYEALAGTGEWHVLDGRAPVEDVAGRVLAITDGRPEGAGVAP